MWMVLLILYIVEIYLKKGHHIHIKMSKIVRSVCSVNIGTKEITINTILSPDKIHLSTRLGMDSNLDNRCVNKYSFIGSIVDLMRVDTVSFDKSIGKLSDLSIVNDIYTYDNPNTFHTVLIQINHEIYMKGMKHSLLFTNQAREYGTIIDNTPPQLDHTGSGTFTITAED